MTDFVSTQYVQLDCEGASGELVVDVDLECTARGTPMTPDRMEPADAPEFETVAFYLREIGSSGHMILNGEKMKLLFGDDILDVLERRAVEEAIESGDFG